MKIESSAIVMASQHTRQVTQFESVRVSIGQPRPKIASHAQFTEATLSAAGREAAARASALIPASAPASSVVSTRHEDAASQTDPKIQLLISMIESLTGHKVKLFNPEDWTSGAAAQTVATESPAQPSPPQAVAQGSGIEYERREIVQESEQTSFAAQGVIKTSDGKEIKFNLQMDMQREYIQDSSVSVRAQEAVKQDPLVINFDGTATQLSDSKFSFDLNSDGNAEQMSFVGAGSGFLALDHNGNGTIDNGSELFGTKSGNGFADLAAYDSDKNNWIDENDAVYSKLKILSKDAAGNDMLATLAERKVGALYLGKVATPFDLKNSANDLQGQIRSSGIYLHEDGSAGTLQQVDLVA